MNDESRSTHASHAAISNLKPTTAVWCYKSTLPPAVIDVAVCEVAEGEEMRESIEETEIDYDIPLPASLGLLQESSDVS